MIGNRFDFGQRIYNDYNIRLIICKAFITGVMIQKKESSSIDSAHLMPTFVKGVNPRAFPGGNIYTEKNGHSV